jgi:tetratricopeptide (TPR) repeat protein
VSLLLDALKRAEQEKLTRQSDRPGEAAPRSAPATAAPAPVLELQPMPGAGPSAAPRSDAQTAQTVFKAKAPQPSGLNRRILVIAGVVIALVVAAASFYLWHSLRSLAPRAPALAARPLPITPRPAPEAAARKPAPAPLPAPVAAPAAAAASSAPEAKPARNARPDAPASATPPEAELDALLAKPQPPRQPPVELTRDEAPKPSIPPDVEQGYRALVAGDLDSARRHYAAAVDADPASLDAELGLATVEARAGHIPAAAGAYRRALELDPGNATALAGLAALADDSRPEALENALRADIARHPDSAALELTLGNLYAAHGRWAEAQAAYFEAQRLQPENADVAYNLAVSLDHLGQKRAAADFYRRALEARRTRGAQFDAAAASRRLAELAR